MDNYNFILVVFGFSLLGVAYLPKLLSKKPLSYPIFYIGFGILLFKLPLNLGSPDPLKNLKITTHLTELCVIISLMGTGLKIDRHLSWQNWKIPLHLIFITMILSIGLMTLVGWQLNGIAIASSLLLASALSPTDPVLASDVQVGPPGEGNEDNVRSSLTTEAGLNDGMAFPLVNLALVLTSTAGTWPGELTEWLLIDVLLKVGVGVFIGWLIGKLMGKVIFRIPEKTSLHRPEDGFVALALTLVTYGATELLHGYGFLAVFIAAIVFRDSERDHKYHQDLHRFTDEIEKLFILSLLILFGGAIADGLLSHLTWEGALYGFIAVFLIRPLTGYLALLGTESSKKERRIISFFGIKGIGSFFYVSYASYHADYVMEDEIWAILGFTVLLSIIVHGCTAYFALKTIDKDK